MSHGIYLLTRVDRVYRTLVVAFRVACLATLLLVLSHGVRANAADGKVKAPARACAFSDAEFDTTTDVRALDEYRDAIAQLLKQEKFADLDCLADSARAGKTRFPGGAWKLRNIYMGLATPRPGHPTQEDWKQHFKLVERWKDKNSHSITAPIVLAESYVGYGWDARGTGHTDDVSNSGWKLYGERVAKAKEILEKNSTLASKCPDWYIGMQQVAQGESWDLPRAKALLQQAAAFEPGYQYYYRAYAEFVEPKWNGEEGDAARFAEETANHVGGDAGDILYFQIADIVVCACDDPEFGYFSWPRLQNGFAALEKKYGASMVFVNSFALMASKSKDWVAADPAFKRIGDNWDKQKWVTETWFTSNRDTAAQFASLQLKSRGTRKEAEANMQSPEGATYRKDMELKLAAWEQDCLKESGSDQRKSELILQIGKSGSVENADPGQQPTPFTFCLLKTLYESHVKKESPFSPPPRDLYWVVVELDPATLAASAK